MTAPVSSPGPLDSRNILDLNYAFARTAMLIAAVRLHLFTYLAEGPCTAAELAVRAGTKGDATARLLAGLLSLGLIEFKEERYQLTPSTNHFLVEGKPGYLGGDTLAMLDYLPAWFELDQTLLTATPYRDLGDAETAEVFYAPRVRDLFPLVHPIAVRTAAELKVAIPEDAPFEVLDLGAGSAPWSAAFALRYPRTHVTAIDLPAVVEQGRQEIAERGLSDRYTWVGVDMDAVEFTSEVYDLIIVAHVCRFIGDERVQALFSRLARSLRPNGTLIVSDVFYADDRTGPPPAITLDLSMLVNTAQGRIRTCAEVAAWLEAAGLRGVQRFHAAGPFPVVIARKEERV